MGPGGSSNGGGRQSNGAKLQSLGANPSSGTAFDRSERSSGSNSRGGSGLAGEVKPKLDAWGTTGATLKPTFHSFKESSRHHDHDHNGDGETMMNTRNDSTFAQPAPSTASAGSANIKSRQHGRSKVSSGTPSSKAGRLFDPVSGSFQEAEMRTTTFDKKQSGRFANANANSNSNRASRFGKKDASSRRSDDKAVTNHSKVAAAAASESNEKMDTDKSEEQQVIHLASYEDRSRGERVPNGQRMLYDPKSGSLVAVKAKVETPAPCQKKRDRNKARRMRSKRLRETRQQARLVLNEEDSSNDAAESIKNKISEKHNAKGKKEDSHVATQNSSSNSNSKIGKKPRDVQKQRKLPRTCGVLFSKHEDGSYYCVDECEADLGYGSHSVPGGSKKNPEVYLQLTQRMSEYDGMTMQHHGVDDGMGLAYGNDMDYMGGVDGDEAFEEDDDESYDHKPQLKWVKPDEKIELVTGVKNSPTLQATAKEWAPSSAVLSSVVSPSSSSIITNNKTTESATSATKQSALLVSATAAEVTMPPLDEALASSSKEKRENIMVESLEQENEEDEFSPVHGSPYQRGLGFDPTSNMDSMMQSPASGPMKSLDDVAFSALSLQPSAYEKSGTTTSSIFAFGSTSTWGSSGDGLDNNADWSVPNSEVDDKLPASSFLNNFSTSASPYKSTMPGLSGGVFDGSSSLHHD